MNRDDLDLLRSFLAHRVEFLLVGAHAVSFYSEPRTTGDLDLFVRPSRENAQRTLAALQQFGAPMLDLALRDLETPGLVYQMGVAPFRIDVLTGISGVSYEQAADGAPVVDLEGLAVPVISYRALLANKRAAGRPQDLEDLALLSKHHCGD